jgi:hypothetical protein
MNRFVALTSFCLATSVAVPAFAAAPEAEVKASTPERHPFSATFQLELLPKGDFDLSAADSGAELGSGDLKDAFAISGTFGYDVIPHLSIGVAPRLIRGVAPAKSQVDSMQELDLRARVAVHGRIHRVAELYGFVAPGYSWVTPPDDTSAKGPVLAFGAGLTGDIDSTFFMCLEVGYQLGRQVVQQREGDIDAQFNFYEVGVGAGARF